MLNLFEKYISDNNLFQKDEKILLAVSGGIDSMVMAHLFSKCEVDIGIAHCNFQLREEESDRDEQFVLDYASKVMVPIYSKRFDTSGYALENKISIQMAARDLRYHWFEEIRRAFKYDWISLAHNQDDIVETFLINLARGTGIRGLSGIKVKSNRIIRPFLFASRSAIEQYQKNNEIQFVEDSSNASVKYKRNRIRHRIIPQFEKLNPNFKNNVIETIENVGKTHDLFVDQISQKTNSIIQKKGGNIFIDIEKLLIHGHTATYLYEILTPYGFPHQSIPQIIESLQSNSGKQFLSNTHRLLKDRNHLIITPLESLDESEYKIESTVSKLESPINLIIQKIPRTTDFKVPTLNNIAILDYDLLKFPLILRKWKKGDRFQPLGMKQSKKVSDYFIDQKISLVEKEKTWLLISENQIVWIVGYRIDDLYKVTKESKQLIQFEIVTE